MTLMDMPWLEKMKYLGSPDKAWSLLHLFVEAKATRKTVFQVQHIWSLGDSQEGGLKSGEAAGCPWTSDGLLQAPSVCEHPGSNVQAKAHG